MIMPNNNSVDTNITVSSQGYINYPLQPCFFAYLGTSDTNATGDNTVFQVGSGNAMTLTLNRSSSMNTNGTFTAPITGVYVFNFCLALSNLAVGHTLAQVNLIAAGTTYRLNYNPVAMQSSGGIIGISRSVIIPLSATNTVTLNVNVDGSTKTVTVLGDANNSTSFSGFLLS